MSIHRWLQILRSANRRTLSRPAMSRLHFEVLEERSLLAFAPFTNLPVGDNPVALVTTDFNNDGWLDLATANYDDSTVSVRLGEGTGGFGLARNFATGARPRSMNFGDFNNDENPDLATITAGSTSGQNLKVLLGNGDGSFRPNVDSHTWGVPLSLKAGDFNFDGNSDLAYAWVDPFAVEDVAWVDVRLSDGSGGFTISHYEAQLEGTNLVGLDVADLNGDGVPDVVTTDPQLGTVNVLLSGGGRDILTIGSSARAVAVGDLTGDGTPDLITAGQTVSVLAGLSDGTFAAAIHRSGIGSAMTSVALADFNADGMLDVVTADSAAGIASVFLGNGDGTLAPPIDHAAVPSPNTVAVGDFDGDRRPDMAAADSSSNAALVLLNDGVWPNPSDPLLQVLGVAIVEGNAGATTAVFTVTPSTQADQNVSVQFATANGTATAGSDYQAVSGTLTIFAGETFGLLSVPMNGDRDAEANETFLLNLANATNATIADGQGVATIVDDEPRISIGDISKTEGKKGQTTLFTFTVSLSAAYDEPVTMSFRTVNGTATTSNSDYIDRSGTLTFLPGETTKTVTISVKGDSKREAHESFFVDLYNNSTNSLFTKNRGLGTILNDD